MSTFGYETLNYLFFYPVWKETGPCINSQDMNLFPKSQKSKNIVYECTITTHAPLAAQYLSFATATPDQTQPIKPFISNFTHQIFGTQSTIVFVPKKKIS